MCGSGDLGHTVIISVPPVVIPASDWHPLEAARAAPHRESRAVANCLDIILVIVLLVIGVTRPLDPLESSDGSGVVSALGHANTDLIISLWGKKIFLMQIFSRTGNIENSRLIKTNNFFAYATIFLFIGK